MPKEGVAGGIGPDHRTYSTSCVHRVLSGPVELELHTWEVAWVSGEISLSVHDRKRWLEVEELEGAEWIEADIPMISVVAKKLASQSR